MRRLRHDALSSQNNNSRRGQEISGLKQTLLNVPTIEQICLHFFKFLSVHASPFMCAKPESCGKIRFHFYAKCTRQLAEQTKVKATACMLKQAGCLFPCSCAHTVTHSLEITRRGKQTNKPKIKIDM